MVHSIGRPQPAARRVRRAPRRAFAHPEAQIVFRHFTDVLARILTPVAAEPMHAERRQPPPRRRPH